MPNNRQRSTTGLSKLNNIYNFQVTSPQITPQTYAFVNGSSKSFGVECVSLSCYLGQFMNESVNPTLFHVTVSILLPLY